ncbi:hypothetical protein ACFLRZ_00530 [Bacteroidota bacterium]
MKARLFSIIFLILVTSIFSTAQISQGLSNQVKAGMSNQMDEAFYRPDPRLYECYDSTFLDTLKIYRSDLIIYLNFFLDNAYFIADLPPNKSLNIPDVSEVPLIPRKDSDKYRNFDLNVEGYNPANWNMLRYNFKRSFDDRTYYKLGNTGKVLVFYSGSELNEMFNEFKRSANRTKN